MVALPICPPSVDQKIEVAFTASPVGLVMPVMKLLSTPLPSMFARPIELPSWFAQ